MKRTLEAHLLDPDARGDEPTGRFVRSYSSQELETQAEALKMCLDILDGVPEPGESTALIKWRMVKTELRSAYAEINVCDREQQVQINNEWKSGQPKRWKSTNRGFPRVKRKK